MTEELKSEKLTVCTKKKIGNTQIKNEISLTAPENEKIKKVITFIATPVVEQAEVVGSEVKVSGFVRYNTLVCLESGEFLPINTNSAFNFSVENAIVEQNMVVDVSYNILDSVATTQNDGDVTYTTTINFTVDGIFQDGAVDTILPDERLFTKDSEIDVHSFINKIVYNSQASIEILKDAKTSRILYTNYSGNVKMVTANDDYFVVAGDIILTTISIGEDGQIRSNIKEIPYSEEIEAKGIDKSAIIQAKFVSKEANVLVNEENGNYVVEMPFAIVANIFKTVKRNCVIDAYCLEKEINLTTESFEQNEFFSTKFLDENIIANLSLSEQTERIEKILSTIPINISVVNYYTKNGEIIVEGIASFSLTYYSEDDEGNNILNSVLLEIPYSLNILAPDVMEGDEVDVKLTIGDINVKAKRGRELDVIAGVKVNYSVVRPFISAMATKVTYGEDKPAKDCALEIYVAKEKQTVWDIAKELNISSEDLLKQNADLSLPISAGEKIIVYHQLKQRLN